MIYSVPVCEHIPKTDSMRRVPSSKASIRPHSQKFPQSFMEYVGPIPRPQQSAADPYPQPDESNPQTYTLYI